MSLKKPTSVVKPAFRCVVEYNWQGLAYLMLEVAGLNFIEAIQVIRVVSVPRASEISIVPDQSKR